MVERLFGLRTVSLKSELLRAFGTFLSSAAQGCRQESAQQTLAPQTAPPVLCTDMAHWSRRLRATLLAGQKG